MLALGTASMQAQASRTWVSGVGDDVNPCSRTAPCKTFAGAISKTATGGEIDALDPGGFGSVTITKSLTIDGGEGQNASVLVSGTNGIVVSAGGAVVTLRNLSINGLVNSASQGINGIRVTAVGMLHVEHCNIMGFSQNGIDIEVGAATAADVFDTNSNDNNASGFFASSTSGRVQVTIDRSRFDDNSTGVFAGNNSGISVRDSQASNNSIGFCVQGSAGTPSLNITNSMAANNPTAGIQAGGLGALSTARISGVSLFDDGVG